MPPTSTGVPKLLCAEHRGTGSGCGVASTLAVDEPDAHPTNTRGSARRLMLRLCHGISMDRVTSPLVVIGRERFWSLIEETRVDFRAAVLAMSPDEVVGYHRWYAHYADGLRARQSIDAVANLWLDRWPEYDGFESEAFVGWLVQQGEAIVEAAVRNPDSLAECECDGAPARRGDEQMLYDLAEAAGFDLSDLAT